MNTTTKTAKAGAGKPAPKFSHAKKPPAPARELPAISVVKLVPLALIDVRPQVRTVFDDASLQELASDIQARGLLQPVLLNPHGARFTLIAGERRVRACRLAELTDIPALITKASEADALLMQLAENIQREDLELQDQVNAIRLLHDNLGTVAAVAETVKKSAPWVSKRLALSHPDFGWKAQRLMENGVTEDVEILNILSHIESLNYSKANELEKQLQAGTATRETARQMLKELKTTSKDASAASALSPAERERIQAERKAEFEQEQAKVQALAKRRTEGTGKEFIAWAMGELNMYCTEPVAGNPGATEFLNGLRHDQRDALQVQIHQRDAMNWNLREWAQRFAPYGDHCDLYIEQMAAILALKGQMIDNLYAFSTLLEDANTLEVNP